MIFEGAKRMKRLQSRLASKVVTFLTGRDVLDLRYLDYNALGLRDFPGVPFLINLPTDFGLTLPTFRLCGLGAHPFVGAISDLREIRCRERRQLHLTAKLREFYNSYQPKDALDILGVACEASSSLSSFDPYALTLPWDSAGPEKESAAKTSSIRHENREAGFDLSSEHGWAWSGPVSESKLNVEVSRLLRVYESIVDQGYQRNNEKDGDIRVNVLLPCNGESAIWQARVGQHRAIVLAGLGYSSIPSRVTNVIMRSQVDSWFNVVNGVYTKSFALDVFDSFYQMGKQVTSNRVT